MKIEVKKLTGHNIAEFQALIKVFEDVFDMTDFHLPGDEHLQQMLDKEDFMVFVALCNNKLVGGLTAYTLHQYYSTSPQVYIYDVAVQTNYQRQGIGKMLIAAIRAYCREAGIEEMYVQAEEQDSQAVNFYRSTGAEAQKVVHFNYHLSPGK